MTLETLLNVCDCDLMAQVYVAGWDVRGTSEAILGMLGQEYLAMQVLEINLEDELMKIWLREEEVVHV